MSSNCRATRADSWFQKTSLPTSGQWEAVDHVGGTITPGHGRLIIRQTPKVLQEVLIALSNLEMMLSDPQHPSQLRLHESEEGRKQWAEYERLLDAPTNSASGEMPLKKFLEDNFNSNGIAISVDETAMKDEGIDWEELKITVVTGVSRRELLKQAFRPHILKIIYDNRRFILTSLAKADEALGTFIYDIHSIPEARDREWLSRVLMQETSGQWEDIDGVGGTLDLIGTDDWQIAGLLIVRQTDDVHEEIPKILEQLRKPLEVPPKEWEPARSRSIYHLPDLTTATDLQHRLPELIIASGVTWPPGSISRVGAAVIVTQTEAVHHRIERLIESLDKARQAAESVKAKVDNKPTKPDESPAKKE